jgi:ABC-2 type transport system permease protein
VINLLRSEWIKFRSVRSTLITLLIAGALVVLVAVLTANHLNSESDNIRCEPTSSITTETTVPVDPNAPDGFSTCGDGYTAVTGAQTTHLSDVTGGVVFAALLFGVLGVQVIGQEYRFNTIRPTFTAAPRRLKVVAAKLIVVCGSCALIAAAMVGFCWLAGSVMLEQFQIDGTDRRIAWGIVVFSVLWSAAGLGVGAIVRQPIAGILILVAESLVVEGLIGGIKPAAQKWLPFTNGLQMTYRGDESDSMHLQSLLAGGIYFAAFCALLVAIGAILVNRRDA